VGLVASLKSLQQPRRWWSAEKGDPPARRTSIAAPRWPFATLGCPIFPRHPYLPKGNEGDRGCGAKGCVGEVTARTSARARSEIKVGRLSSHGNADFARKTFSLPVEPHLALHAVSYHGLRHTGAKSPAGRRIDARTSRLGPAEHELSVCRARPRDTNVAFRHG